MKKTIQLLLLILFTSSMCMAQKELKSLGGIDRNQPFSLIYKEIDTLQLKLTFHYPEKFNKKKSYPCIIFYFGGGWNGGSIKQFKPQAEYFASRGMITVLADYRVRNRHKTTPYESVEDAKSAIRFLRKNAEVLNINSEKIVASGGSAGGHLAAACGVCPQLDHPNEDLSISSVPNALILFNPVFDNGPEGFEHKRMGEQWRTISPAHNITAEAPPTIVFLGREDPIIPVSIAENYKAKMDAVGRRCDLFLYDNAGHGFFNNYKYDGKFYKITLYETDMFLKSIKYIKGKPKMIVDSEL
ncbi:alpha/beta hydrolase [Flammeovirga aprica]|uniref:Alpha/beta hydrolase n=1 Tax=Flammeovirga aprica JL-4 TaxID=694437 RepID=A0A7X9RU80_9BACT|nr:alpha/beta hydrolase [Flammeovirga aprica]NME68792.1 alpha/beta hydrolase [Flammeovirga aprica JL-4]